ncbi:MAG: hypothetical protein AVDCRST_MAG32-279 [uncultured Nocardioides sp.]|uniref:Uncharacterized protein n=1 Tax=uncultured Nocardioides sp. TaxID=198441 RepID=A0A6J4MTC3_9ACTN|nr:MAG: hypothetical protein AVDCRST_MAG32-279 [uncultured Nocardioides sp.]
MVEDRRVAAAGAANGTVEALDPARSSRRAAGPRYRASPV